MHNIHLVFVIFPLMAYLLGSVPTAVWTGRIFYNIDIRTKGSGNAGATNTIRVLGLKAGIPVMVIDIAKGWFAVFIITFLSPEGFPEKQLIYLQISSALAAVLGHIFPVYAGFRGGKGVATIFGAALALFPYSILAALGIFVLSFLLSRIVSISSILAAISFPIIDIYIFDEPHLPLKMLAIAIGIFIPLTHIKNIKRLLKGEEHKFSFGQKK